MTLPSLTAVLSTMDEMVELELMLAALYTACSEAFPEDRDFWQDLTEQEQQHAEFIARLKRLVASQPGEFDMGRAFNSTAIQTIKRGLALHIEQLHQGHLARDKALFIVRDIENSVLETNYRDILKSNNVEFKTTIETIVKQTATHKIALADRIAKLPRG